MNTLKLLEMQQLIVCGKLIGITRTQVSVSAVCLLSFHLTTEGKTKGPNVLNLSESVQMKILRGQQGCSIFTKRNNKYKSMSLFLLMCNKSDQLVFSHVPPTEGYSLNLGVILTTGVAIAVVA